MSITTLGIDIAKSVFQLHGIDEAGKVVIGKKLRRSAVLDTLRKLEPCLGGMEACATARFWAREIAVVEAAQTGRTHDRIPADQNLSNFALAEPGPSTHDNAHQRISRTGS